MAWFNKLVLMLDAGPRSAAMNMAVDQALLESAAEPVLRVYQWDQPSISFGYSHSWEELKATLPPWPAVRRWTGGGVVWHDEDTTYSLIVPACDPWSQTRPLDSYRLIHQSLAELLDLGSLAGDAERLDGARCFESPALFDIMQDGKKIAGAGQRRNRQGLLHQGSVRLRLEAAFWRRWAETIGDEVVLIQCPSGEVLSRAAELVGTRYGTSAWLEKKD